jgi:outer membrane protein assembly factor BamB
MMKSLYVLILFCVLHFSCSKKNTWPPIVVSPIDTTKVFEQKWQTTTSTNGIVNSRNCIVYKNLFLTAGARNNPATLYAWDTKTGEKVWEWSLSSALGIENMQVKGNTILLNTLREFIALDLDTRQVLWQENFRNQGFNADNGMTVTDHDVYIVWNTYKDWGLYPKDSVAIFKYDIKTGNKEKIFGFGLEDGKWAASISEVCFWHDPITKDSILLFNKHGSNAQTSPQEQPTDFYAINIRTKKVLWRQEKYCPISSNMTYAPVVYGDDVIVEGDWSIYSFDIPTGKLNWRSQFTELGNFDAFGNTQLLIVGDRLFINPVSSEIMCLNAKNGTVVWYNKTDAPNCTEVMHHYKDMLIFTSWPLESVMVLDAINGQKIHKQTPSDKSTFHTDIAYDPVTDMFFTQTYISVYGFKINKPK